MLELFQAQTFAGSDLPVIGLLIILEGVLSIDNALVLGLLAKRLPKKQQGRALTYGLVGAFVFRAIAIATAALLMKYWFVKLLGGLYLLYVAAKYFFFESKTDDEERITTGPDGSPILVDDETGGPLTSEQADEELQARSPSPLPALDTISESGEWPENSLAPPATVTAAPAKPSRKHARFWPTVVVIELTDIAFAVDSILAAMALVSSDAPPADQWHPKLWVVLSGGLLGVILMRVAAVLFIRLLEKFPRFEVSAYLLVAVIGGKLLLDWAFNPRPDTTNPGAHQDVPLNFHSPSSVAFWVFWLLMLASLAVGFIPKRRKSDAS